MNTISGIVLFNADTDFCIGYKPGDQLLLVLEITDVPVNDGDSGQVIVDRIFRWLNSCVRPFSGALRSLSVGDVVVLVPGGGLQPKAYAINYLGSEELPFVPIILAPVRVAYSGG